MDMGSYKGYLFNTDESIQDFLDNPRYNNCENIQFNWRVFNDNEQLDYEDKPLNERFPVETKNIHEQMIP